MKMLLFLMTIFWSVIFGRLYQLIAIVYTIHKKISYLDFSFEKLYFNLQEYSYVFYMHKMASHKCLTCLGNKPTFTGAVWKIFLLISEIFFGKMKARPRKLISHIPCKMNCKPEWWWSDIFLAIHSFILTFSCFLCLLAYMLFWPKYNW